MAGEPRAPGDMPELKDLLCLLAGPCSSTSHPQAGLCASDCLGTEWEQESTLMHLKILLSYSHVTVINRSMGGQREGCWDACGQEGLTLSRPAQHKEGPAHSRGILKEHRFQSKKSVELLSSCLLTYL